MTDIAFVSNSLSKKSDLGRLYNALSESYSVVRVKPSDLAKMRPVIVLTDMTSHLHVFVKEYNTFFVVTKEDGHPFLKASRTVRRMLLPSLKYLSGIFVSSPLISQQILRTYKAETFVIDWNDMKGIERKIRTLMSRGGWLPQPTAEEQREKIAKLSRERSQRNLDPTARRKIAAKMPPRAAVKKRLDRANRKTKNRRIRTAPSPGEDNFTIIDTPKWFTNNEDVDVSIIVPMYRSSKVIQKQIQDWDHLDDGLSKEIIYVDDHCPNRSHESVMETWENRRQHLKGHPVGKIIVSHNNRGYGQACNLGAKYARGKYLIFLNADVCVTPNWVRPMCDVFESDPQVGIVGNLQIQQRMKEARLVDSAGSMWLWRGSGGGSFAHLGRNVHEGEWIDTPMSVDELPEDISQLGEREMVTGCCFMIPRSLFYEVEGFNEAYLIGYWEDSDLNLIVREKGYKIIFQPESQIFHLGGHSRGSAHSHIKRNREYFKYRWVSNGIIDDMVAKKRPERPSKKTLRTMVPGEVVGCIIACNEEEFLEVSVDSIAPLASRFVIVVGGNEYARAVGMCTDKGMPLDSTLEIAHKIAKKYPTTIIEPPGRPWKHKTEMRNAYAEHLHGGDWMFMLDGDEVYSENQLWRVLKIMQEFEVLRMQYYLFWNNVHTLGTGSWGGYPQERIVYWREGYHYKSPNHLGVVNAKGKSAAHRFPTFSGSEKLFYHYAYVRPLEKIRQKIAYYEQQLLREWRKNDVQENYMENVFLKWRHDPTSVRATHPRGGGGTCPFAGIHPRGVTKLIEEGKLDF